MNLFLIFPGFIIAFIIVLCYERKIRNISVKLKNKVHFYVVRDDRGRLWLYISKPKRSALGFIPGINGIRLALEGDFSKYGLDANDYVNLKWEDEPLEVFLNMDD